MAKKAKKTTFFTRAKKSVKKFFKKIKLIK